MARISAVPPPPTYVQRGFSLVELAIVLMIVGLLIGGMVLPLSAQQDLRARQDTERMLAETRDALAGFAVLNGRLPRPATSATDGSEATAICASDAACSGFVPWATLGTPRTDAWGKLIRYSVTPAFANAAIALTTIPNRTVQTRNAGGATVYLAGAANCNTASQCLPAVVFSQGKQRWGTTDQGTALADGSGTNVDEDTNENGPTSYFARLGSDSTTATGGEFDDIVIWIPANTLINRLVRAGTI